jgi:hypothetical protein
MTNNIIINNYSTPLQTEGKSEKSHRKTMSMLTPLRKKNKSDKTINSSGTFEHSETNRIMNDIPGFNNIVKDISVDNSIDTMMKEKNIIFGDDILSDSILY